MVNLPISYPEASVSITNGNAKFGIANVDRFSIPFLIAQKHVLLPPTIWNCSFQYLCVRFSNHPIIVYKAGIVTYQPRESPLAFDILRDQPMLHCCNLWSGKMTPQLKWYARDIPNVLLQIYTPYYWPTTHYYATVEKPLANGHFMKKNPGCTLGYPQIIPTQIFRDKI